MRFSFALVLLVAPALVSATLAPCHANLKGKCPKLHNCKVTKISSAIQAAECSYNTRTYQKQTYAVFKQDHQYDGNHGYPYGDCYAYTCKMDTKMVNNKDCWTFIWDGKVNGTKPGVGTGCIKDPHTSDCGCEDSLTGKFHVNKTDCVLPFLTLALLSGGAYAADEANAKIFSRSLRVFATGGHVLWDYRRHFRGTERDDPDYRPKLQSLNERIAQRLLCLCFQNGGVYTKLGQQLATFNHGLPREYTETLAQLQDRAKPVPFEEAKRTIEAEMGRPWQELFKEFDRTPVASASLAQVHRAVDHQGRELAVKVQYPHLEAQMEADIRVIKWAFQLTEFCFPDVQIQWLYPEFKRALLSELDFENEKNNSRRIAACLKHNSNVHVPVVYDELSSKRMMSMEFIAAPKISQIEAIRELGLDPPQVARALCEVFSEMVFCHEFVHCDPHAGNIFVRRNPDPQAEHKEQLVLLDHGLYRELDGEFRKTYCDLWRAMLTRDSALLEDCGKRLNVGELSKYLPLLLTYRTINHKGRLDTSMSESERKALAEDLKGMRFSTVTDFLEQLPRDMLFVFRTNNMIRALNKELGGTTRERFSIMGNYAVSGHSSLYSGSTEVGFARIWGTLGYWWEHLNLVFRLRVLDYVMAALHYAKGEPPAKIKRVG
ncbi:hypothetical protein PF005_g3460 [Phytophthora fragariae]|uniref:ABC1 atypical kinase-like domain-containing protein n=1 Tax=Phytophthora fragariae TaxID=53985 RepID=A0A6A3FKQ6_9STRA|nr:hypothetical protein PF009_g4020 [Phytophthora fragariae]KAE9132512.1 hypothetical protein PF007_g3699 [Phytophthora fragariae]KAE9153114.1 hypothetical protein PF006_g2733 [Phytophthora fragariae]KAE9230501.1 hypothetical protein PF005_g3460 [Phytophthora fragariae]KAE9251648.1 hypothetical protein PF002_g4214 [Phytophthora fragariae]